jgi:hypothetical protein
MRTAHALAIDGDHLARDDNDDQIDRLMAAVDRAAGILKQRAMGNQGTRRRGLGHRSRDSSRNGPKISRAPSISSNIKR